MAQYNLIKDYFFRSLTSGGTGTVELTNEELFSLYDGNTTSSGVVLSTTDVLYLQADTNRDIRLDRVHINLDTTLGPDDVLNHIDFYYKNYDSEVYVLAGKSFDADSFYLVNSETVFAPSSLRIVISNINATLNEVVIYNDDVSVAFGLDGSMVEKRLNPEDAYSIIPVYNNSTDSRPATAYVSVDPGSGDLSKYLLLSNSVEGPYYGPEDAGAGVGLPTDAKYKFDMGEFYNTSMSEDGTSVVLLSYKNVDSEIRNTYPIDLHLWTFRHFGLSETAMDYKEDGVVYTLGTIRGFSSLYLLKSLPGETGFNNVGAINGSLSGFGRYTCMVIIGDYGYILLNLNGDFGRINITTGDLTFHPLASCPNGSLPNKLSQGICSDKNNLIYCATLRDDSTPVEKFHVYDISSNSWSALNSDFTDGIHNGNELFRCSMSYNLERDLIYLDCGEGDVLHIGGGIQCYHVSGDYWSKDILGRKFIDNHCISYYYDFMVFVGYDHEYDVEILNMRTGETYFVTMPYSQRISEYYSNPSRYKSSHVFCYPMVGGRVGVLVSGGYAQEVYHFCLGTGFNVDLSGTYTSPIFHVGDEAGPAFFHAERTCPSGTSITYGELGGHNSVMVRGFDTPPVDFGKTYVAYKPDSDNFTILEFDLFDKAYTGFKQIDNTKEPFSQNPHVSTIKTVLFDNSNKDLIIYLYNIYNSGMGSFCRYSLEENRVKYHCDFERFFSPPSSDFYLNKISIDSLGTTWFYNGSRLYYFNYNMTYDYVEGINIEGADFINCISASTKSSSCWFTNRNSRRLECTDKDGNVSISIPLKNPTKLCALEDGGCSVVDDAENKVYRFSATGEEISACKVQTVYDIETIKESYTLTDKVIYWILLKNGTIIRMREDSYIIGSISLNLVSGISSYINGLIAYSDLGKKVYQIDNDCNLVYEWDNNSYDSLSHCGDIFHSNYYNLAKDKKHYFIDMLDDPVWGKNVDNWSEVRMDDSYFSGRKYYQMKFKLNSYEGSFAYPELNSIYFSKSVKIPDIYPGQSRNLYVKTRLPEEIESKDYTSSLRCWWTRRDE